MSSLAPKKLPKTGLERLLKASGKTVVRRPRTTVAQRKAQLAAELTQFNELAEQQDESGAVALQETMTGFIKLITQKYMGEDVVLSEDQAYILMSQALARRTVSEFMGVCLDHIRGIVFGHLNAKYAEDPTIEDPENTPGEILVPALGMKFAREACGQNPPTVDEDLLKMMLPDRWKEVYEERIIPEHTEYELNLEKLVTMALTDPDPDVRDRIVGAIEPGTWKSPRLAVKPM